MVRARRPFPDRWYSTTLRVPSVIPRRNAFDGPGYFNIDASLFKTIRITAEMRRLQLRAEAFNLLNHTNFAINTFLNGAVRSVEIVVVPAVEEPASSVPQGYGSGSIRINVNLLIA